MTAESVLFTISTVDDMKQLNYVLILAAAMLTGACSHNVHDFDQPSGKGYLAVELQGENPEDVNLPLHQIHVTVDSEEQRIDRDFDSKGEVAAWLQSLAVGEYEVLVTADMSRDDGYVLDDDGVVSVADPASSPGQAWFAVSRVAIRRDNITKGVFLLQRLMARLLVTVHGVPEGTSLDVTAGRVAQSVAQRAHDATGRFGLPDSLGISVPLRPASAATRTVSVETGWRTLLPTARNYDRALLELTVGNGDGRQLYCQCDIPRMESGYSYVVDLDYEDLKPNMYLDWYRINDWTYGAVIYGKVELPDDEMGI